MTAAYAQADDDNAPHSRQRYRPGAYARHSRETGQRPLVFSSIVDDAVRAGATPRTSLENLGFRCAS